MSAAHRIDALAALEALEEHATGDAASWQLPRLEQLAATVRRALHRIPTDTPVQWRCSQCGTVYGELIHECITVGQDSA